MSKKRHCRPEVPEIGEMAREAGGWHGLAQAVGVNPGSLVGMARGRRRMPPKVRTLAEARGHRPPGWHETVAAILDWATQPPPRKRWRSKSKP